MAVMQLVFTENWPMGQEIRRPGEIVFEGPCLMEGATPDKIEKAIRFNAVAIRIVPEAPQEKPQAQTGKTGRTKQTKQTK